MAQLEVIFGPPGTGKTTTLTRLIGQYVADEGSDSVTVCAFTRAAAKELAGRDLGIEGHQLGTIHSLCFHALDRPPLAEAHWKEWNATHPVYQLSDQDAMEETTTPFHTGDEYLAAINLARHRLIPETRWLDQMRWFWQEWQEWKQAHGYCDYTDLIDKAYALVPIAPGRPRTLVVDECQDLSLLQWRLLRQWGQHADRFIGAGDDDQALYRWAGADVTPLLEASTRHVLPQSYRVPRAIQAIALDYAEAIQIRQEKEWRPRDDQGEVIRTAGQWERPQRWLAPIREWLSEPWGTIAVLAPCGYMLAPMIQELRAAGIPFSNRWRRKRRDWNPLTPPSRGTGMVQRLRDFARPADRLWTWSELATWLPLIRTDGVLVRGAKSKLALHADETSVCTPEELHTVFLPSMLHAALHGGYEWLEEHVLQSHAKALAYPLRVVKRYGEEALTEEPRLTVGNCHSVKGAEADRVILFTELSRAQYMAWRHGGEEGDDVLRMLYVGVTRAREMLTLVHGRW